MGERRLLTLPRAPHVNTLLLQWADNAEHNLSADMSAKLVEWLRLYFEQSLPLLLLYEQERWQLEQITEAQNKSGMEMRLSDIYGAEHLLRLMVKLPSIVAQTSAESGATKTIEQAGKSMLAFMDANSEIFFAGQKYQTVAQRIG